MKNVRVFGRITPSDCEITKIEIRNYTGNITHHETEYVKLVKYHTSLYIIFASNIHIISDITSQVYLPDVAEIIKYILDQYDPEFSIIFKLQKINKSINKTTNHVKEIILTCLLSTIIMIATTYFVAGIKVNI